MSGKVGYGIVASNVGEFRVSGRINIGASGAVSSTSGDGFTAAKAATGKYTITLPKSFKKLIGFNGTIHYASSAAVDKLDVKSADDNTATTTRTFSIVVVPGDSTTLTNPSSGDAILFEATFLASRVSA